MTIKPNLSLVAFILLAWAVFYVPNFNRSFILDDDRFYYSYTGHELFDPARAAAFEAAMTPYLANAAVDADTQYRQEIRANMGADYILMSLGWGGLERSLGYLLGLPPIQFYIPLTLAFFLWPVFFALLMAFLIRRYASPTEALAIAGAVLVTAALNFSPVQGYWMALETGGYFRDSILFALNLPDFYNIFGHVPRSLTALTLPVVFLLRWRGRHDLGYWVLLPISLFHFSNGAMMLAILIGLDLICRPQLFRQRSVIAAIIAVIAVFLWATGIGTAPLRNAEHLTGLILAALAAIAAGAFAVYAARRFWLPLWQRYQGWINRQSLSGLDCWLMVVGWLVTQPIIRYISVHYAGDAAGRYFWWQIHNRTAGFLVFILLMALACYLIRRFQWQWQGRTIVLLIGAFLALATADYLRTPFEKNHVDRVSGFAMYWDGIATQWKAGLATTLPTRKDETVWYYSIVRDMAADPGFFPDLQNAARAEPPKP